MEYGATLIYSHSRRGFIPSTKHDTKLLAKEWGMDGIGCRVNYKLSKMIMAGVFIVFLFFLSISILRELEKVIKCRDKN